MLLLTQDPTLRVWRCLLLLAVFSTVWPTQSLIAAPQYTLDHVTTTDGLPQSSVRAIIQDHQGFLWVGTEVGLARYDGYRFEQFSAPFGRGVVTNLSVDSKGRIWVFWYDNPVTIFDPANSSWEVLKISQSPEVRNGFIEDVDGTIWLSDSASLYFFDESEKKTVAVADLNLVDGVRNYQDIVLRDGVLWINAIGEIVGYDTKLRKVIARIEYRAPRVHENVADWGLWSRNGEIWFCSHLGVFRIGGPDALQFTYGDKGDRILSCGHDSDDSLWIGTDGSGAIRIDAEGILERFEYDADDIGSIAGNSVNNVQQDAQGNLWLMTYGTANLFRDGKFERFEYAPNITKSSGGGYAAKRFIEDNSGVIWLGSEGSGLARISRYRSKFRHLVPPGDGSKHVRKPAVDAAGNLWLGMQNAGIYKLNRDSQKWLQFTVDPENPLHLPVSEVRALLAMSNGEIWAGNSSDVISKFEPVTRNWTNYVLGRWPGVSGVLPGSFNLLELPDGDILVGATGGVTIFDRASGSARHYPIPDYTAVRATVLSRHGTVYLGAHNGPSVLEFMPNHGVLKSWSSSLNDADVFSLHEDRFGYLWVGTWGEGLFRLDPATGETQQINNVAGLPDDTIFGILPDDADNLWVSTYAGLARIENCVVDAISCEPRITTFGASDGLPMTEFDSESHLRSSSGELFFGGGKGLIHFYPRDIKNNPVAPAIRLTGAQLNDEPLQLADVSAGEAIVLENAFGTLSLQFSSLDFHNPANNQYRYRLDPESSWTSLGSTPNLTLNNLGMGRYAIQIMGSNNDGVWSERPLLLRMRILPPPYFSNLAIASYTLALFLAVFVFVRTRERKLRTNKAMLESMVDTRTKELNDVNAARDEFYANVSHEVRTPLTLLLNSVERLEKDDMNEQQQETARSIRRHSESLHRYIDSLITVSHLSSSPDIEWFAEDLPLFLHGLVADIRAISGRTKITLVEWPYGDIFVRSYPNALNAIFSNLVINALKYTPNGSEIKIVVEQSDEWTTVTIADSGPGIDDEALGSIFDRGTRGSARIRNIVGFGIGLNLVKQTVQVLGGEVSVRKNSEQGACFEVRLAAADSDLPISSYQSKADLGALLELSKVPAEVGNSVDSRRSQPLVLVVEDHDELRGDICDLLEDEYRVIQAADGTTAIALAEKYLPDVVICDVMLPDIDGFHVLSEIKTNIVTDHIAVMLLTALADEESRMSGLAHRADAYLTKPYTNDVLRLTVRNLLVERRTMMRYSAMKVWQEETTSDIVPKPAQTFEYRFMAALHAVYSDNEYGIEEIAKITAMSRRQLERKTRSCFEQSPNVLLSEYRLIKAAELLRQGLSVGEAAYRCGFGNQSHFATVFRKRFRATPVDYKKQQRERDN